jgi:hypothetical protein
MPGFRGAEGKEKGKGVIARWGLEEAQSKSVGRRTGIPPKAGCGKPNLEYYNIAARILFDFQRAIIMGIWDHSLKQSRPTETHTSRSAA